MTITCPVGRMTHERKRGNKRAIFCRCGSAAGRYRYGWHWFRLGSVPRQKPAPEMQTEGQQAHGPEIDL